MQRGTRREQSLRANVFRSSISQRRSAETERVSDQTHSGTRSAILTLRIRVRQHIAGSAKPAARVCTRSRSWVAARPPRAGYVGGGGGYRIIYVVRAGGSSLLQHYADCLNYPQPARRCALRRYVHVRRLLHSCAVPVYMYPRVYVLAYMCACTSAYVVGVPDDDGDDEDDVCTGRCIREVRARTHACRVRAAAIYTVHVSTPARARARARAWLYHHARGMVQEEKIENGAERERGRR